MLETIAEEVMTHRTRQSTKVWPWCGVSVSADECRERKGGVPVEEREKITGRGK
jgi:hypothetical protein